MDNNLVNFEHAREEEQRNRMRRAFESGECPFCEKNLDKYHQTPIERQGTYWSITKNAFPYKGTRIHYLAIYRPKHISHVREMDPEAMLELHEHIRTLSDIHAIEGGVFFMRFGDTNYNGSSIEHLHVQILSGEAKVGDKDIDGLMVKLGYKKKTPDEN